MGTITSGVGLISGLNTSNIIDQLMSIEERPKTDLQKRIETANTRKLAYADLSTRLTSIRLKATTFKKPNTFKASETSTSNESVVTATAAAGAAVGSYQLRVARLVTTQQNISRGFADVQNAKVGAGKLTIELGGGELSTPNNLSDLNGGAGVRRGQFRITDRSGASSVIDIGDAVSLDDVVKKINTSLDINVKATLDGDKLVLDDLTGSTTQSLRVQDIGGGFAAADLGIASTAGGNTLTGSRIQSIGAATSLTLLNDGLGVRTGAGTDFNITARDGSNIGVDLLDVRTVGDVIEQINTAGAGKITASVRADGKGIQLTDTTGGTGNLTVNAVTSSKAAEDLGLVQSVAGGTITGGALIADLGTTLIRTLNGGKGFTLGTISVKNRAGATTDIDLSGASDVQDVLDTINNSGAGLRAQLKSSGNGIELVDTSGGAGDLVISDSSGTTAADFGFAGTYDITNTSVQGANLQRQWLSENTLLKDMYGGKGVPAGKFKITNSAGISTTIDLTQADDVRVSDVISEINSTNIGVKARINDKGDGIVLEDSNAGTLGLKVADLDSTTAKALNLAGTSDTNTLDGSYEKTIDIAATDSLADVQKKINDLSWGTLATIINDGSPAAPYRLSLSSTGTGRNGRATFDGGATSLDTRSLVEAQDAAVFVGGSGGAQPLLVTASSNSIAGVIKGVTLNLNGTSDQPVTVGVTRSVDAVLESINGMVESFNELLDQTDEYTKFDSETNTRGTLLGDSTVQTIEDQLYAVFLGNSVNEGGKYRIPADVGIRVGEGGRIEFDEDKFRSAFADDAEGVTALFTKSDKALESETQLSGVNSGRGVRTGTGDDIAVSLRDGTSFNVDLSGVSTVGALIERFSQVAGTRMTVEVDTNGTGFRLTDNTTGTKPFTLGSLNGSSAGADLGILGTGIGGVLNGRAVTAKVGAGHGGIGAVLENRINRLIDPVSGAISRVNKSIDTENADAQDRIDNLDKLLEAKRTRLLKQFANLESTLAQLQGQQTALSSFTPVSTNNSKK